MNRYLLSGFGLGVLALAVAGGGRSAAALAADGLVAEKCGACHDPLPDGGLARISAVRKTPEGWQMTIRRMRQWHRLDLSDTDERKLVKLLADTQGLAPAEAAPYRAVLERRPGTVETGGDPELTVFCARCHTYARFGLQRRDAADWVKNVHMHLGQWPTVEYQASARDRQWFKLATTEIAAKLGKDFPFSTPAWSEWRTHKTASLAGQWDVAGHRPGKGDYRGTLKVTRSGADAYSLSYALTYADGSRVAGKGRSLVYTGYEWRGSSALGKDKVREVYQVAADGDSLSGRWFLADESAIGADFRAVRANRPAILAVQPAYLKAGQSAALTIVGSALAGRVDLGAGVTVERTLASSAGSITVLARAAKDAAIGPHGIAVGTTRAADALTVYDRIGSVRVEPALDVGRVGGGPVAAVPAQFEAVAYTGGGVRIGVMPATWTTTGFDGTAQQAEDARFGGRIDRNGLFVPAGAGPNPARHGANNDANLAIVATVVDGTDRVEGRGHLIVSPQRWNDNPIR